MDIPVSYQKWEATGNDFFFVDSSETGLTSERLSTAEILAICDRTEGKGADGVVFYDFLENGKVSMLIVNADGSLGDMCGNALRCLAEILFLKTGRRQHCVILSTRQVEIEYLRPGYTTVEIGRPEPLGSLSLLENIQEWDSITTSPGYTLSFGNPHYVVPVSEIPQNWIRLGRNLQSFAHERLGTGGINLGFVETSPKEGTHRLVVFERGVGPTKSCGSGACAASAVLEQTVGLPPPHTLQLPGGLLSIGRQGRHFTLSGPAFLEYESVGKS